MRTTGGRPEEMNRSYWDNGVNTMLKVAMDILTTKRSKLMVSSEEQKDSDEEGQRKD